MEDKINVNPSPELPDEALNIVSGGVHRRVEHKAECKRCRYEFPETSLLGGYCPTCYNELKKEGIYIPL